MKEWPTAETLCKAFPDLDFDGAEAIEALCEAVDRPDDLRELIDEEHEFTRRYVNSLMSDPYRSKVWRRTVALHAMDVIMCTHGVEYLASPLNAVYLNAGDTYATTLVLSHDEDALYIMSWGDLVEAHAEIVANGEA